ncbi:MAG: DotU family type IV/VI secretion system protein [Polaromonas sp.]
MHLVDCFIPLMAYVRHFQSQPSGDVMSVQGQIDSLLREAKIQAQSAGFNEIDTTDASFAVAAWIDEMMLATPWAGVDGWKRQLLQRRYFNVSNAGVAFFTRMDALSPQQSQVREVYFFCICMGFAGRYGYDRNPQTLADIKNSSLKQLVQDGQALQGEAGKMMFPEAYAASLRQKKTLGDKVANRWGWKMSTLTASVLLVPLMVLVVLYGVYHLIIWQSVNAIMAQIK